MTQQPTAKRVARPTVPPTATHLISPWLSPEKKRRTETHATLDHHSPLQMTNGGSLEGEDGGGEDGGRDGDGGGGIGVGGSGRSGSLGGNNGGCGKSGGA